MADSIMMWILHSAMNKAHDKVQCKDGVIERLCEQSKFYELAIMQLEACVMFLQEEGDCHHHVENMSYVKLLTDLAGIGDRLRRRLKETESALADKDREMVERHENELKLGQKLERREKELKRLRADRRSEEEAKGGELGEIKQSVDQQVLNLEDEKVNRKRWSQGSPSSVSLDIDSEPMDFERVNRILDEKGSGVNAGSASFNEDDVHDVGIDQMGFEVDRLKETLDTAFMMMQDAVLGCEISSMEMEWRQMVEKDTLSTSLSGFMREMLQNFEDDMKRKDTDIAVVPHRLPKQATFHMLRDVGVRTCNDEKGTMEFDEELKAMGELLEESSLLVIIADEIQTVTVSCLLKSFETELCDHKIKDSLQQCIGFHILKGISEDVISSPEQMATVHRTAMEASDLESLMREDVYLALVEEMRFDDEVHKWEALLRDEICWFLVTEKVRDACILLGQHEARSQSQGFQSDAKQLSENISTTRNASFIQELDICLSYAEQEHIFMPSSSLQSKASKGDIHGPCSDLKEFESDAEQFNESISTTRNASFIQELDMWLSYAEQEEGIFMPSSSLQSKASEGVIDDPCSDLEGLGIEDSFNDRLLDEETALTSTNEKLENALMRLGKSIILLKELESDGEQPTDHDRINVDMVLNHNDPFIALCRSEFGEVATQPSDLRSSLALASFSEALPGLEHIFCQKMNMYSARLEKIKCQIDPLIGLVVSLRKTELMYRRAFFNRCENLQKAEAEVDLLGDQVDSLLELLGRIYATLETHSPVLQRYPWVQNILASINNELNAREWFRSLASTA
ncbi:hypothetical protein Droror1_Dr00016861 [Drosera rotundifolia]